MTPRWTRRAALVGALAATTFAVGLPGLTSSASAALSGCTWTLAPGATNTGVLTINGGTLCDSGSLTNTGTIQVTSGSGTISVVGSFANKGTIAAGGGSTLALTKAPTNLSGTTLSGGTWTTAGTISMPGTIHTVAASVTLTSSGEIVDSANNSINLANSLQTIASSGTFHLNQSAAPQTGSVTSYGRVILGTANDSGDSVNWQDSGTFTMKGGSFTFLDGSACINIGSRAFIVSGGVMSGYGMLTGSFSLSGNAIFSPTLAGPPAQFWLNGTYTQTGGTFLDDVTNSSGWGSVGSLNLSSADAITLGGTLLVTSSGSRPATGTTFQFISGGSSVSGHFAKIDDLGVASFTTTSSGGTDTLVTSSAYPPGAPKSVTAAVVGSGSAKVSWKAAPAGNPATITSYVISASPGCACSGLTAAGNATSSTVSGLVAGVTYKFTVHAENSSGEGVASAASNPVAPKAGTGYWLATANGGVFGAGTAVSSGGTTAATGNAVVGIARSATAGYYLVQRDGNVTARGGAIFEGDLQTQHVVASDVVAIAPTVDGRGYWLVGRDGGIFTFGDAKYHGSIPGLGIRVTDVVGMVATPSGTGYLMVGADGGVFTFGAKFHGSLPGLHIKVHDIVGVLPTALEAGYVLVGADGGAFVFGRGSGFYGSLPGINVKVSDIVGLALTSDAHGYWMGGADGTVYAFGDAERIASPSGVSANVPVVGIAAA